MHVFEFPVRLQHTDAAGIVFFADFFHLAHLAYEDLLDAIGFPLPADLGDADVALPLASASSEYRAPLRLGERVHIEITVGEVTSRSFTLRYRFVKADGAEAALLTTVHVAVDTSTGRATRLPGELAAALRERAGM